MNKFFFILFLCFYSLVSAQDCYVQKKNSVKIMQKMHQNLPHYSFLDVKNILEEIEKTDGVFAEVYDMYSLIYWLKEDVIRAEFYAQKTLKICPEKFSTSNYVLGILNFRARNYQSSVDFLQKSISVGLRNRFKDHANEILESAIILSEIMNDTVPYNPEIVKGISTEADEYLPLISPDQEIALYTRRGIRDEFGVIDRKSEDFVVSKGSLDSFDNGVYRDKILGKILKDPAL